MKGSKAAPLIAPILAALAIAALTLYAYRGLAERPFAADDYQWLLGVRDLSLGALLRRAFDPAAQSHFFRPLIWLLFWAQTRAFGLDPRGFHAVSLALHLLNALLLGWLAYRLTKDEGRRTKEQSPTFWSSVFRLSSALAVAAIVALHPAPFEAVVWISAQSELLAAALLLTALHLLLSRQEGKEARRQRVGSSILAISLSPSLLAATLALGLALLAKESAVIGLPLLVLLGARDWGQGTGGRGLGTGQATGDRRQGTTNKSRGTRDRRQATEDRRQGTTIELRGSTSESWVATNEARATTIEQQRTTIEAQGTKDRRQATEDRRQGTAIEAQGTTIEQQRTTIAQQEIGAQVAQSTIYNLQSAILPYVLPTILTIAYVVLQVFIERRNYLLAQGGYGLGAQVALNPLRSLALIVAPLPGTEHADAPWLVPLGALVALLLLGWAVYHWRRRSTIYNHLSALVAALALTLLPTAPFASPPDSRYLYLPVMAAALLVTIGVDKRRKTKDESESTAQAVRPSSFVLRRGLVLCSWLLALTLAWWASGELHAREGRFAAASGPGGSLWRVATAACADSRPDRMVIVEPPIAPPHVEAIVGLACGEDVRTKIVGPDQIEGAIKGHSIVIAFPNGSADIQRRT